jgi:predicted ATP-grasp superfamily ATP-dependent carboligase
MRKTDHSPTLHSPLVFVAEYLSGGGMFDTPAHAIPESLLREGTAMWRSLVDDFAAWTRVCTPIDPRLSLPLPNSPNVTFVNMENCAAPWAGWIEAASRCDVAVVIIPESDGLLTKGISLLRASGIEVLAPSGAAIGLTADKWATAKWLHAEGIAHPDTWSLERRAVDSEQRHYACSRMLMTENGAPVFSGFPDGGYLVKPRDGCGAMDIRHYHELQPALISMQSFEITQQQISGRSASVLVIADGDCDRVCMLPAVWQDIATEPTCSTTLPTSSVSPPSHFVYRGGSGPIGSELQHRAHALVSRVLQAMPGKLSGFIGIDLMLGEDANHDTVIEINPRLTTSYIGIRKMTAENLTKRLWSAPDQAPMINVPTESVNWQLSALHTDL